MPKYTVILDDGTGWSPWIKPVMEGYKMACCDCGLVHELDFGVVKQKKLIKEHKDGRHVYEYEAVENPKYQVTLRARRHTRATAQHRRRKKIIK